MISWPPIIAFNFLKIHKKKKNPFFSLFCTLFHNNLINLMSYSTKKIIIYKLHIIKH